ncbi:NB-ARC domains-containing protein [Tanacetum coccineum]
MKLRYCCNLTTTPDFSEITNLEELSLEGCVNLVSVHPSIGMLKRLVVLNLRDCKRLQNFPSRVEMDALQVLNLTGCLKVDQLPEALGRIKSLTELHVDRTAITELPSFVSSLINLESLSFGGQGRIQPRWWTSITAPFGFIWKQQHPPISVSLAGLHNLKFLKLSYCNLEQVPESIGGLSFLEYLNLVGNNFTSLPGSLSQLSHLQYLYVDGCKKLEVLPELPPSIELYYGNSIPEWFTNRSMENHVKVELPSDWCYDKFRGYGTCVVFKCKKSFSTFEGYSVKNFDGASLTLEDYFQDFIEYCFANEVIGIQDSYMIWLHYRKYTREWKEAKNFVTFCFEENNEDVEVKECGARLICDGDLQQDVTNLSMFQDLPTLSQHGRAIDLSLTSGYSSSWSW